MDTSTIEPSQLLLLLPLPLPLLAGKIEEA